MTFKPATITSRFWAIVLDCFFLMILSTFIGALAISSIDEIPEWMAMTFFYIIIAGYIFYIPLCETFMGGCTIGKKMVGLRTVRTDGSPASGVHCLQRFLMLTVDVGLTLGTGGLITAMVTKRRQRLGDLVADTMVVRDNKDCYYGYNITREDYEALTPAEQEIFRRHKPTNLNAMGDQRIELARTYRAIECDLAWLRTHKGSPALINYLENALPNLHMQLHRHQIYTWGDMIRFALRSIPRAVYESRWAVLASLVICMLGYIIGVYSQITDPGFFRWVYGDTYTDMTIENIANGTPMAVYAQMDELEMFFAIFFNNLLVSLKVYALGVFTLIGPLFILLHNLVGFGAFDTFFAQQGHLAAAMITPNEHGLLELWTVMMVGGASIRLGTGWLFPGRLTRLRALARSARQSMLIVVSAIPMLMIAAFIESFVTRHTEWPLWLKLSIIISCAILIIVYYVMLPIIAKDK